MNETPPRNEPWSSGSPLIWERLPLARSSETTNCSPSGLSATPVGYQWVGIDPSGASVLASYTPIAESLPRAA